MLKNKQFENGINKSEKQRIKLEKIIRTFYLSLIILSDNIIENNYIYFAKITAITITITIVYGIIVDNGGKGFCLDITNFLC